MDDERWRAVLPFESLCDRSLAVPFEHSLLVAHCADSGRGVVDKVEGVVWLFK